MAADFAAIIFASGTIPSEFNFQMCTVNVSAGRKMLNGFNLLDRSAEAFKNGVVKPDV